MSRRRSIVAIILGAVLLVVLDAGAQPPSRVYRIRTLDASSLDAARLEWWDSRARRGAGAAQAGRDRHRRRLSGHRGRPASDHDDSHRHDDGADPVSLGLVTSLARPGGNITGMTKITSELGGKRFQLLRELMPKLSRLAVLWHVNRASALAIPDYEGVARAERVTLQLLGVRRLDEVATAFSSMDRDRAEALIVIVSAQFFPRRKELADLAIQHRLPTMHAQAEYVEAGGLMSYAPSYREFFRRAAIYVDKILNGARPGDLPIEQPSKLEMVINLKTARALGLTIPQSILVRADRVIE
jgi:ABC-type uncharacterized transport system substrate-binding protein